MRENRKKTIRIALLVLILLLGIGYAALTAKLKVDGTVHIDKATWDVHFENVQVTSGSVEANPAPTTNNVDTTEMTYTINFTKPGDFYEFTVDMVNDGTIDAMVNLVSNKTYSSNGSTEVTLPSYLTSTVTYDDGVLINQNQLLAKESSETIKVRVEFKKDISASDLPSSGDTTVVFKFSGNFKQADETACPKATTFQDDDWDTIQCNVKQNPQSYAVGATKEVTLTGLGTYTVRVANNTTPEECSTTGFSQSSCGFIVEFQDIISKRRMNLQSPTNTASNGYDNRGGWEYSDMRAYLNGTTYAADNIDYSTNGIYNLLPTKLKNVITKTTVVSGYSAEKGDTSNFITEDYLFLLAPREIWGATSCDYDGTRDSAYNVTRQLDFYSENNTTACYNVDAQAAWKKMNGTGAQWWTRSPMINYGSYFMTVNVYGNKNVMSPSSNVGVSPAFRIG